MSEQNEFVSCSRINGRPILPPVMTPRRRREMQEYKLKALAVEQKLKERKLLKEKKIMDSEETVADDDYPEDGACSLAPTESTDLFPYFDSTLEDVFSEVESNFDCQESTQCKRRSTDIVTGHTNTHEFFNTSAIRAKVLALESISADVKFSPVVNLENSISELASSNVPVIISDKLDISIKNAVDKSLYASASIKSDANIATNAEMEDQAVINNQSLVDHLNSQNAYSSRDPSPLKNSANMLEDNLEDTHVPPFSMSFDSVPIDYIGGASTSASEENLKEDSSSSSPPRLVRRGTYTLDYPSLIFRANMDRFKVKPACDTTDVNGAVLTSNIRTSLTEAYRKSSSSLASRHCNSDISIALGKGWQSSASTQQKRNMPLSSQTPNKPGMVKLKKRKSSDDNSRVIAPTANANPTNLKLSQAMNIQDNKEPSSDVTQRVSSFSPKKQMLIVQTSPISSPLKSILVGGATEVDAAAPRRKRRRWSESEVEAIATVVTLNSVSNAPSDLVHINKNVDSAIENNAEKCANDRMGRRCSFSSPPAKISRDLLRTIDSLPETPLGPPGAKDMAFHLLGRLVDEQQKAMAHLLEEQGLQAENMQKKFKEQQKYLVGRLARLLNTLPSSKNEEAAHSARVNLSASDEDVRMSESKKNHDYNPNECLLQIRSSSGSTSGSSSGQRCLTSDGSPSHYTTAISSSQIQLSYMDESESEVLKKFSKLSALVKGYLTRRLLKTVRVLNIKTTIQDLLMSALKLHSEVPTDEDVNPADIHLYGRIIAQLTAACNELHHVCFGLSVAQQMAIINADRQRLNSRTHSL